MTAKQAAEQAAATRKRVSHGSAQAEAMRRLVYISGPISAASATEVFANIGRFSRVEYLLLKSGFAPVNPAADAWLCMQGEVSKEELLEKDHALIVACDAMMLLDGWEESAGATQEYTWAVQAGVPTVTNLADLHNLWSPVVETSDWLDELPADADQ
jgi:hypothetical protein